MTISARAWADYIRKLSAFNERAAAEMRDFVLQNGFGDMTALIDRAFGLATRYGEVAAALAAEMYDAAAELSGKLLPAAEPAETASYDQVAKTVQGVAKVSQNPEEMGGAVGRLVKRAGADTTLKNAIRDGAEFAWVPSGDTCAFCITLASRGWQRASEKALKGGHAEHIHSNCDCTYAVRFDGKGGVAGYDPEKYLRIYEGAEGDTPREKINALRRENYAEHKEEINAQKRAAYAERNEFRSVLDKYIETATPGVGEIDIPEGREIKNREEINLKLLHSRFGGDISMLPESSTPGHKNPDYLWRGSLWEEQEPKAYTKNAIDQNIREAIHQIIEKPGGIVLDIGASTMPLQEVGETSLYRLRRSSSFDCDLILIRNGEVEAVWRFKKNKR